FDEIPLSAFERVNPAYVSERLSAREDDIVWRVRLGDEFLYVYILLECQSGVDRWMALRMQTYIGLLYQDLVKRHALSPGLLLPPVLPLVFYNGLPHWSASMDLAGL
ncbi:Rpn family recombination-promoting nuclease/putative transposase, partial [Massilia genomosp. 1]